MKKVILKKTYQILIKNRENNEIIVINSHYKNESAEGLFIKNIFDDGKTSEDHLWVDLNLWEVLTPIDSLCKPVVVDILNTQKPEFAIIENNYNWNNINQEEWLEEYFIVNGDVYNPEKDEASCVGIKKLEPMHKLALNDKNLSLFINGLTLEQLDLSYGQDFQRKSVNDKLKYKIYAKMHNMGIAYIDDESPSMIFQNNRNGKLYGISLEEILCKDSFELHKNNGFIVIHTYRSYSEKSNNAIILFDQQIWKPFTSDKRNTYLSFDYGQEVYTMDWPFKGRRVDSNWIEADWNYRPKGLYYWLGKKGFIANNNRIFAVEGGYFEENELKPYSLFCIDAFFFGLSELCYQEEKAMEKIIYFENTEKIKNYLLKGKKDGKLIKWSTYYNTLVKEIIDIDKEERNIIYISKYGTEYLHSTEKVKINLKIIAESDIETIT